MKCKVTYDTHCSVDNSNFVHGYESYVDEDGNSHKTGRREPQLYPKSIIIKDGNGDCWKLASDEIAPETRVPGEIMLNNVYLIKNINEEHAHGNIANPYWKEAQRLAEILNTGDFQVVAVNFKDPVTKLCYFHCFQINSMEFYADNGKVLYTVPSDRFNYDHMIANGFSDLSVVDDKGTLEDSLF